MAPEPKQPKAVVPEALPPLLRKSMESGVICDGAVGENRMPETAVHEAVNMNFDTIGAATLRAGDTALGNNLTSAITGLYYFVDTVSGGAHNQLIAVEGTVAYYLSGATWTSIRTGLTSGSKARFSTFLNFVFMCNGTEATAIWDGIVSDGFVTTGNAASAPTGSLVENFRGRMWIGGNATFPSRVYYSSVPSAASTPVITWATDPVTGQWIDISPSDGENLTGMQRFRNSMLCFKQHHIYRIFDIGQVDPDPYYNVGTYSQESVVETKAGVYFHDASGFYLYNIYGVVAEVSRPIIDYIRAIPVSSYASVTGWIESDGNNVTWAVGTITVKGVTYTNCHLRYTISTQVWTVYIKPTQFVVSTRRPPFYNDGTTRLVLAGDKNGNIVEIGVGTQDVSSTGSAVPISYYIVHRWENIDTLLSTRKTVMIANFSHSGGAGTKVNYQTELNDPYSLADWTKSVGMLQARNTGFPTINVKARKMRFRIAGSSTGQPFTYHGYELLEVMNEFMQFDKE